MSIQKTKSQAAAPTVSFVSLGCPKALVDSERIITKLRAEGYGLARDHKGADLVIVNTCGFLDSAKAESLEAIGNALAENGKVVVTGCMGAEPENITAKFPDVLAITGPQQYESVLEAVHRAVPPLHDPFLDLVPPEGVKLTPAVTSRSASRNTSAAGRDTRSPRSLGMMQKVQRLLQPSEIFK